MSRVPAEQRQSIHAEERGVDRLDLVEDGVPVVGITTGARLRLMVAFGSAWLSASMSAGSRGGPCEVTVTTAGAWLFCRS